MTEAAALLMSRCSYGSSAVLDFVSHVVFCLFLVHASAVVSAIVRMCPHFCVVSVCVRIASALCPHVSALII